jgi:hypothetical protein
VTQAHTHFPYPPRQEVPFAVPYIRGEQDRIPANIFNDNIKPSLVKIVFQKSRIAPIDLPLILVKTPEGGRHGEQGAGQDKHGFKPSIQGREKSQHTASQSYGNSAVPFLTSYAENQVAHDHPHDIAVNHAETGSLEAVQRKGEQKNPALRAPTPPLILHPFFDIIILYKVNRMGVKLAATGALFASIFYR